MLGQGFTAAEVDDAKRYLIGSLPRQLETNAGIAGFLLSAELYGLGIDHDVRLPALIGAVTHDQVARVAARLLDPDRAVVAWPARGADRPHESAGRSTRVFFDVDFTLIHPGPRFHGPGYAEACARARRHRRRRRAFDAAVTRALPLLDDHADRALRPRSLHPLHRRDHRAHGRRRATAVTPRRHRDLRRLGGQSPLRSLRRRARRAAGAGRTGPRSWASSRTRTARSRRSPSTSRSIATSAPTSRRIPAGT